MITFDVLGIPAPQGSKTSMHGRVIEGGSKSGRAKHKAWRTAVAETARDQWASDSIDAPCMVAITFRFPRPKSWPKKRPDLLDTKPDLDKLVRSTLDGLTDSGMIRDDCLVTTLWATKTTVVGWTGATIVIAPEVGK